MGYENIIVERNYEDIVEVTFNRPQALNALNNALCSEFKSALEEIQGDDSIAVVLIKGAGRAFSAGVDLKEHKNLTQRFDILRDIINLLWKLEPPLIACVNGFAITGGFELALACDIVIASTNAVFRDTHAQVGILPGGGNSQRLPRIVGEKKAKEIIFTSDFISATEAERMGFVNKVVPPEKFDEECMLLAQKIAAQPKKVLRKIKQMMNDGMDMDYRSAIMLEQLECLIWYKDVAGEGFTQRGRGVIDGGRAKISKGRA